jgi:hypothetical protein
MEMDLPEEWDGDVKFYNRVDAVMFGCPIYYPQNEIPDTKPIFDSFSTVDFSNSL